ncbi:MAG: hypothetical protein ACTSUE_05015 [Promethearchaeota archaeon]
MVEPRFKLPLGNSRTTKDKVLFAMSAFSNSTKRRIFKDRESAIESATSISESADVRYIVPIFEKQKPSSRGRKFWTLGYESFFTKYWAMDWTERRFHEFIRPDVICRVFYDIDIENADSGVTQNFLKVLVRTTSSYFAEIDPKLYPDAEKIEYVHLNSSRPGKQSHHLVFDVWVPNINELRNHVRAILERMYESHPQFVDPDDNTKICGVDTQPYKNKTTLRIAYSHSSQKSHCLVPNNEFKCSEEFVSGSVPIDFDVLAKSLVTAYRPPHLDVSDTTYVKFLSVVDTDKDVCRVPALFLGGKNKRKSSIMQQHHFGQDFDIKKARRVRRENPGECKETFTMYSFERLQEIIDITKSWLASHPEYKKTGCNVVGEPKISASSAVINFTLNPGIKCRNTGMQHKSNSTFMALHLSVRPIAQNAFENEPQTKQKKKKKPKKNRNSFDSNPPREKTHRTLVHFKARIMFTCSDQDCGYPTWKDDVTLENAIFREENRINYAMSVPKDEGLPNTVFD